RELRDALARRRVPCVAVSPLIGGRAVKGPADRMLQRLTGGTSPAHVASCYPGLIDALVVDEADADDLEGLGDVRPLVTRTLISDADLVVLAPKADAALATAAALADVLGGTPLLSVASELRVTSVGALPGSDPRSLAERAQELVGAPVVAGLHSLAAGKLAHG